MTQGFIRSLTFCLRNIAVMLVCFGLVWQGSAQAALFGSVGIKDEQELGRKFDVLVRSRLPLVEDPEISLYVRSLVERLAKVIPPQPFPFVSNVLLHNSLNAFAVPGGYVFINTGLIMNLESESELASVIAHELAHVTQRHVAKRMERAQVTTVASLLGALAGALLGGDVSGGIVAGSVAAGQSAMLNYSRMDENESDHVGMQYLIKAGFNPNGMAEAFKKIQKNQWTKGVSIPEYLSTHPDIGNRVNEITALVKTLPLSVQNRAENNSNFERVQTLLWARYGDTDVAARRFAAAGNNECLSLMAQGILAERNNQINTATTAFEKALQCSPKDPLIAREAGIFYYSKGHEKAEYLFKKALSLDEDDLMAQFYYARLLSDHKRYNEAHDYFRQILRHLPEDSEVHYYYGRSLGEARKTFDAFLHLAYSALYQNNRSKIESWIDKARKEARSSADETALKRFETSYNARKEYWK